MINMHDYTLIPEHLMISMMDYVEKGYTLGGFLTALFANDFMGIVGAADEGNLKILPVYASWIHNKTPMGCHGSYKIVNEWMEKKRKEAMDKLNEENQDD